jgi:hypothetical protein
VSKWQRFKRLPAPERGALLRALILLPVTKLALRTIGFRRWKSVLSKFAYQKNPSTSLTPDSLKSARHFAHMVASASDEGIFHGKCLEQSMVLWWLLKRQQLPAELQLGGRRTNTGFEAHAWVEVEGNVINDHDTVGQDFAPFSSDADSLRAEPR